MFTLRPDLFCLALLLSLLLNVRVFGQQAYPTDGPSGAALMQKARQLQAAGNSTAAAVAYQQAYAAYTSVDDSDGMTAALAGQKALAGRGGTQASGAVAATRPTAPHAAVATSRPVVPALPVARATLPAAGSAPVAGRLVGGKPVGLFFVTKSQLGRFFTMTYYFAPNGIAYEDPLGLSAAELAATPARNKGRYSVAGKTLSIAWTGAAKPESAEMHPLTGGFSWADALNIFSAVGPFKSSSQLVGSFEGGSSTYSPMGGVLSSRSLKFNADGTYTGGGVVTATTVTERSVAETNGSSKQTGRWSLNGWYLTLTDAQGHSIRDIAYPVGTDAKVTLFNFNGTAYSRQ